MSASAHSWSRRRPLLRPRSRLRAAPAPTAGGRVRGPIVVGFDGSPESAAAADWAAREAVRRRLPLQLVQAWPWPRNDVLGSEDAVRWGRARLTSKEADIRTRFPSVEVSSEHLPGAPNAVLQAAGRNAAVLVLGSRGMGTLHGFLAGSVSQEALRLADCPVVLVRAGRTAADEHVPTAEGREPVDRPYRDVALGLDLRHPCDAAIAFAFEAAALRAAPLRVIHAWGTSLVGEYMALGATAGLAARVEKAEKEALSSVLWPWRERYPQVVLLPRSVLGSTAPALLDTSAQAGLLVLGRRSRPSPLGPHLGPVAHAAVHHAVCTVAVVPCR
ncbi:universal stress protein [Kitasatospora sp. NBC_00240]|uniref:universal stress protein n=1 Tax=Kitasatospora sp. NBC_00240 TaxID=2903567 RepID=UPI00224F41B1|nr:universal stress protein [Kitasatospora sp. NBC_00240]MCX5208226.1 universal stress protein [Kitasatospora sp. NBC_00240]